MDFIKMWFNLKGKLNKKNSWGKNELKSLMEEIEIKESKRTVMPIAPIENNKSTIVEIKNNTDFDSDDIKRLIEKATISNKKDIGGCM